MGISVQAAGIGVQSDKHYLVNLNADPSMNELLVCYLKVCVCVCVCASGPCMYISTVCMYVHICILPEGALSWSPSILHVSRRGL